MSSTHTSEKLIDTYEYTYTHLQTNKTKYQKKNPISSKVKDNKTSHTISKNANAS